MAFGGEHSSLSDVVADVLGRRMGLTLSPDAMPHEALFVRSDHSSSLQLCPAFP